MTSALRPSYDAVVVGSGHNGLVAAAYLARAGKSVLVLEKADYLGGATASKRIFPDYEAYLSRYSYLISLLPQKIVEDLDLRFETRRRRTASFTPYNLNSRGLVLSNVDPARSRESFREMDPSEEAWTDYQRFLKLEIALAKHVWPSFLEPIQHKRQFKERLKTPEEHEAWRSFVEEPLGVAIERHARHDALRGLLMTDGKIGVFTHPHDPSLLQNRCFLYHVVGGGDGEWRVPVGGMRSLVDALVRSCRNSGAELVTNSEVIRLDPGPTSCEVTFLYEGEETRVKAGYALINAAPKALARMTGATWQPRPENEGSVIKMNMLLERLPNVKAAGVSSEEAFAGSFHIDEGYAQMLDSYEKANACQIPNPTPGEIYCHTLTDPSILSSDLQLQGYQTLTLFGLDLPYRLFTEDHDARREHVKRLFLEGLDRICDEPFIDCVARDTTGEPCIEIKTPQDLEEEVGLDQGNIFHTAPSWFYAENDDAVGKWGVETEHPRIVLAGSSAHRGGAVSGIPGHNAAMKVLAN